jgi:SH3-like domain-containing protein
MIFRLLLCIAMLTAAPAVMAQDAKTEVKPQNKPATPAKKPEPPKPRTETAPDENAAGAPEPSLPLPRFVSFRTDPVNLRTGPGVRYPVEWIYMRRRLPVEIVAEFETWRQIRDPDGAQGWVHQSMLSGRRTGFVKGEARPLRKANAENAEALALLEPSVVVDIQRCPADGPFCRVEAGGLQGWLKRDELWGVYPDEKIE